MTDALSLRPLDPAAPSEIDLVARRMRATLVEVEGEAVGTALYTLEWLRDRVRWHLDRPDAAVLLAVDAAGQIVGHTIVRKEEDADTGPYGLFSTTYVVPEARRAGVADALLRAGEDWMRSRSLPRGATWTSAGNTKLIRLYAKHGYTTTATHVHEATGTPMVRLARELSAPSDSGGTGIVAPPGE